MKKSPSHEAGSSEIREQITQLETEVAECNRKLDREEVLQIEALDDAGLFKQSIEKCIRLSAEVDRLGKLIERTRGELANAEGREMEQKAIARREKIAEWARQGPEIYGLLGAAREQVLQAIQSILQHQNAGRALGLIVIADPLIFIPSAMKCGELPRYLKIDSPVYPSAAVSHCAAYRDPEAPPPPSPEPAPPRVIPEVISEPTPWEIHSKGNRERALELEERQKTLPAWVGL